MAGVYRPRHPERTVLYREVLALLLGEELVSQALVEKIMGWRHSGFSVHSKVRAKTRAEYFS